MLLSWLSVRDPTRAQRNTRCNKKHDYNFQVGIRWYPSRIWKTLIASRCVWFGVHDGAFLCITVQNSTYLETHMTDVHSRFVIIVRHLKTLQPAGERIKKQIINNKGLPGEAKSLVVVGSHVGIPIKD